MLVDVSLREVAGKVFDVWLLAVSVLVDEPVLHAVIGSRREEQFFQGSYEEAEGSTRFSGHDADERAVKRGP